MNFKSLLVGVVPILLLACSGTADPSGQTQGAVSGGGSAPQCTGALPQICEKCADGEDACAHWEVVNGKCEVEICPASATPQPEPEPAQPSSPTCSGGALPQICEVCANGQTECAHWVDVNGQCEVEICPPTETPPPPPPPPPTCSGALPRICEVCTNGQTECAHWEVINNQCEVVICN